MGLAEQTPGCRAARDLGFVGEVIWGDMVVRWFLFESGLGRRVRYWLEQRHGIGIVDVAEALGQETSGVMWIAPE